VWTLTIWMLCPDEMDADEVERRGVDCGTNKAPGQWVGEERSTAAWREYFS